MRSIASLLCILAAVPAIAQAQGGMSQSRMEDDCLQRLRPLVPRDVQVQAPRFGALGNQANYYVVTYRFSQALAHGQATAVCTYRRDGQWVSDDAAKFKLAQELDTARAKR
jgi:hypothetical protein